MYSAWLEELYQFDWFTNIYWKNLICGSLNQWFVRDDRCSQKHLVSWGLNIVFLTIWKCCDKCQLQAMFSFCCVSLFRQYVLVNYSDLGKIASIRVQCVFCLPLPTGHMLLIQIFLVLEWGSVIRCKKPELAVWPICCLCLA